MSKKLVLKSTLLIGLVIAFISINLCMNRSRGDYTSGSEYVRTMDIASLIDQNCGKKLEISFEIKSDNPGKVWVYQNNGSNNRYYFRQCIDASQKYERKKIYVQPILVDATVDEAFVAFYGEYGTGVIPHIRDLQVLVLE